MTSTLTRNFGTALPRGQEFSSAAENGNVEILYRLLNDGIGLLDDVVLRTFLRTASRGKTDVVMWLLQYGGVTAADSNSTGQTALLKAAAHGHIDLVKELLKKSPATIEQRDQADFTAVLCAAANDHHELVKWLFSEAGALNAETDHCGTALIMAIENRAPLDHVKWLVANGYSSLTERDTRDFTVTMLAAEFSNVDALKWLVKEKGVNVNDQCGTGMSALMCAARYGSLHSVQWLLTEGGADISQADEEGMTALVHAADHDGFGSGRQRVLLWLLAVHKQTVSDGVWDFLRWSNNLSFLFKRKSPPRKRKPKQPYFLLNGVGWGVPSALFRYMLKSGPPPMAPTTILEQPALHGPRLQDMTMFIHCVCAHAEVLRLNLPLWHDDVKTIVSTYVPTPLVELVIEYCVPSTDEFWSIQLGLNKSYTPPQNSKKRKANIKKTVTRAAKTRSGATSSK